MPYASAAINASDPIGTATPVVTILTNILQFLLSIVGVIAIIGLGVAGALYFFAAGDLRQIEKAKRAMLYSITGIVIALGGLVLVRTLASFV
ncbi:MAG: TrbC/VirB2 family protein [Candidatus Moraniibacteriota bacterium]